MFEINNIENVNFSTLIDGKSRIIIIKILLNIKKQLIKSYE